MEVLRALRAPHVPWITMATGTDNFWPITQHQPPRKSWKRHIILRKVAKYLLDLLQQFEHLAWINHAFSLIWNGPMDDVGIWRWDLTQTARTQELAFLQSIGSEGSGDLPRYSAVWYTVTHGEWVKIYALQWLGPIWYGQNMKNTYLLYIYYISIIIFLLVIGVLQNFDHPYGDLTGKTTNRVIVAPRPGPVFFPKRLGPHGERSQPWENWFCPQPWTGFLNPWIFMFETVQNPWIFMFGFRFLKGWPKSKPSSPSVWFRWPFGLRFCKPQGAGVCESVQLGLTSSLICRLKL